MNPTTPLTQMELSTSPKAFPVSVSAGAASRALSENIGAKIAVRDLAVYYRNHPAIKDISINVLPNRITAIIGPSGCGKSTLLRTLNRMGDLVPHARAEGQILLDHQNILAPNVDVVDVRRRVGMVFQRPNPFPKSIYDNVAFGPRLYGINHHPQLDEIVE